jgi:hypothetical protein
LIEPPKLPLGARALNRVGAAALRLHLPVLPLREDALLDQAARNTGLTDFGPAEFRTGLGKLVDSLNEEANLSTIGRMIARQEIVLMLENRLGVTDWHKRYPEIGERPIERPVIVIGMGRTGTTILHHLIGQDTGVRVPRTWEVDRPCPPPETATCETDARIAEVQAGIDRSESLVPDFKKMHPMGAMLSQECVRITAMEFASLIFSVSFRVPSYTRWLAEEADQTPAYATHRRMLQLLQWRCPGETGGGPTRWFLKSPGHLWALPALLAEYPDALLVQTHRDPLKVLSSLISLQVTLRKMGSDVIDTVDIAREWARLNAQAYHASIEARRSGLIDPARVVDVHFTDLVAHPLETIDRVYGHLGLELGDAARAAMKAHLSDNPADKHGRHEHRFEDLGLDLDEERARVSNYQNFFNVPSEVA